MADVYRMPRPEPPPDAILDQLDIRARNIMRLQTDDVAPAEVYALLRDMRDALRSLRIDREFIRAERDSVEAIAKIRRDAQTVDDAYRAYDDQPPDEPDEWGDLAAFREAGTDPEEPE